MEGLIAIGAGVMAGSIALVGFRLDSLIEVSASVAALWRLYRDRDDRPGVRGASGASGNRGAIPPFAATVNGGHPVTDVTKLDAEMAGSANPLRGNQLAGHAPLCRTRGSESPASHLRGA